jgi:putative ABC transport system permease protein
LLILLGILWRDLWRHPVQVFLTLSGIAGGVAVVVAIDLASQAAYSSFNATVEGLAGRATHQVSAASGIPSQRLADLKAVAGVQAAQPLLESLLPVAGLVDSAGRLSGPALPPLRLVGIDPFLFPPFVTGDASPLDGGDLAVFVSTVGGVYLPQSWLRQAGWKPGNRVRVLAGGRALDLKVLQAYPSGPFGLANDNVAVCDIATAQEILNRLDRIDRIDLILQPHAVHAVQQALHADEQLDQPQQRGARAARLLDAFRFNLMALGALALLVGGFLVYNAAEFSVVRRRELLGRLRCLGCRKNALLAALLAETALIALGGICLGLAVGWGLAQLLAGDLARTISALYGFAAFELSLPTPGEAALLIAAALAVALAAAFFPALDAASTPPRQVLLHYPVADRFSRQSRRFLLVSLVCAAIGLVALLLPTKALLPAYIAVFSLLMAGAALLPLAMRLLLPRLGAFGENRAMLLFPLAVGEVDAALSRTGPAAASLSAALAMAIAVTVMVHSFEREVIAWIDASISADIYVSGQTQGLERDVSGMPAAAVELLRHRPEVAESETLRGLYARVEDRDIFIAGVSRRAAARGDLDLLAGQANGMWNRLQQGQTLISEPLANHNDLGLGDSLVTYGRSGRIAFNIAGIFRDFSTDRGYAILAEEIYLSNFTDTGYRIVALYLKDGYKPTEVAGILRRELASSFTLDISANADLRQHVLTVFSQTFAVTFALSALSTLLALVGLATTLTGLLLERHLYLAVLRAIGARMQTALGIFWLQALLICGAAVAAALPLGALLAFILVDVINRRAFGWSIALAWPWAEILYIVGAALASGLVAGLFPLAATRRRPLAQALRRE